MKTDLALPTRGSHLLFLWLLLYWHHTPVDTQPGTEKELTQGLLSANGLIRKQLVKHITIKINNTQGILHIIHLCNEH